MIYNPIGIALLEVYEVILFDQFQKLQRKALYVSCWGHSGNNISTLLTWLFLKGAVIILIVVLKICNK